MSNSAIERAAGLAGGQSALARSLGVKPQAVQKWVKTGRVPSERVIAVETAVERRVTRHELRPDIYPPAPVSRGASLFSVTPARAQ